MIFKKMLKNIIRISLIILLPFNLAKALEKNNDFDLWLNSFKQKQLIMAYQKTLLMT